MMRPMTEDDLQAYVDGRLEAARLADVEAYLAENTTEARRVERLRHNREALRAALAPIAAEPVPPEMNLAGLIEARRHRFTGWRNAAAAVMLLAVGGAGGWFAHQAPPRAGVAALAQETADNYAVYAHDRVQPVEFRANQQDTLRRWAAEKLGRPLTIPDLSGAGYRLMGGRLVATPHGPAMLVMYDNDRGNRLVLMTRLMERDKEAPLAAHAIRGTTAFTWADSGLGFSITGQTSREELETLANTMRKQTAI